MIEVYVTGLAYDTMTNAPVVLLKERNGLRVLPIWIGMNEASVIALELSGMSYKRPLTHDLIKSILNGFNGVLQKKGNNSDFLTFLPISVNTSDTLLNSHRIPWKVIVDDGIAELEVQTLSAHLRRQ